MKEKRLKICLIIMIIIMIITTLILTYVIIIGRQKKELNNNKSYNIKGETINNFSIKSNQDKNIVITVERKDGIKQVEKPNGDIIYCNDEEIVAFDYEVDKDEEYTFKVIDSDGNEVDETIYVPSFHIETTKSEFQINLDETREELKRNLWEEKIATNYITIGIGEESFLDTEATDMATVFNTWSSFGDGVWKYDSKNKYVYNTKNTSYFTGYYAPNGNYNDIILEFEARTTDSDDDMIGAMIRFNRSGTSYNSYVFVLDRHDNGGGLGNGAYNGLNKVINQNMGASSTGVLTKLSVNASLRWTRNTWQKYKLITKGNNIQAYIDDKLVANTTDSSITSGSYGFLCLSQANTYFRNIKISTTKENSFADLVNSIVWEDEQRNIIVHLVSELKSTLSDENTINKFNDSNIHYIGVGNENDKTEMETFIGNIENKGSFINIELEMSNILDTIAKYIKNMI